MSDITLFNQEVANFNKVTPAEARAILEQGTGGIVFIGRESCPYCRRFSTKLSKVASEHQLTVNFLHSQEPATLTEVQQLRDYYGVPTVPGYLYTGEEGVKVKCDSSMSEEEILAFVTPKA